MKILAGALILLLNLPGLLVHAAAIGPINVTSAPNVSLVQRNIGYSFFACRATSRRLRKSISKFLIMCYLPAVGTSRLPGLGVLSTLKLAALHLRQCSLLSRSGTQWL